MAYCTTADLENALPTDELIRLTDDAGSGAVDSGKLTEAIDDGAAEIDGYLAGRYEVPISTAPQILVKVNRDLAIYYLYGRVKQNMPELWKERYENAIRLLTKVGEGKLTLGIQPPPDAAGEGNYEGGAQVTVRTKDFDGTTMGKY